MVYDEVTPWTSLYEHQQQQPRFVPLAAELLLKPFLMQSDSASRKRPFSTGLFLGWILLSLLLIVGQVDFIVLVLFLEAVGVREHCCTAVEIGWQLLCFALCPRATARRTLVPASWWLWA